MKVPTKTLSSLQDFVDWYCTEQGFGSMNKNDFEVFLFNEWLKKHSELSDYAISRQLRIPESKVKRLRYEAAIVYAVDDNRAQLIQEFLADLKLAKYRNDDGKIRFLVHNKIVRQFINDILEQDGRFLDSSLTSSTVSMSVDDFIYTMDQISSNPIDKEKIIKEAKKMYNTGEGFNKTFPEIIKDVLVEQAQKVIGHYTTDVIVATIEVISKNKKQK